MNRYFVFTDWFQDCLKEWLMPKFSGLGVLWSVTLVLFSLNPHTPISTEAAARLNSIFTFVSSPGYIAALLAAGALFSIFRQLRLWSSGRKRNWHFATVWFGALAALLKALYGGLFYPLIVASAAVFSLPTHNKIQMDTLIAAFLFYLSFGVAIHALSRLDMHPRESIQYSIWSDEAINHQEFHFMTAVRLDQLMSYLPWVGKILIGVESDDGFASICVPIQLHSESWLSHHHASLHTYMRAIEQEWRERGLKFEKTYSPGLRQKFNEMT